MSASQSPELVVGEAVTLDLRLAKLPSRTLAFLLDLVLQFVVLLGVSFALGAIDATAGLDSASMAALSLVMVVGIFFGYPIIWHTLSRGKTLGKMALGLRVVRDDGGPIRFRHALVRGLFMMVDFYLLVGVVALVTSLVSVSGKRLGDMAAGTVVINERARVAQPPPPAMMPPGLAAWAATLDLAHLPQAYANQARALLARWHSFAPAQREVMATQLASSIATKVSPPAPGGTPAASYLSAVLAERFRREITVASVVPLPLAGPAWDAGSAQSATGWTRAS